MTYVGRVSQQTGRRAAFGAAVLGMLLALSASVGITLAPSAPTQHAGPVPVAAADVSVADATAHVEPSVLPAARSTSARTIGTDRLAGGPGDTAAAFALLAVAFLALAVAADTRCRYASRAPVGTGPRAPPTPAAC